MKIDYTAGTMMLGELPFYWRIKSSADELHPFLPSRMKYTFEYVPELDLLQSLATEELSVTLSRMYKEDANIGFLKDEHTLAKSYGGDFLVCLNKYLEKYSIENILEIGCGGCLLLEDLAKRNYNVQGVDPSPVAVRAGKKKNIEVIQDFFPSEKLQKVPDLIFHVDVFEHVTDPVKFLKQQKQFLSDTGIIIINVPDCTDTIKVGDISIAQHQHVNSFDVSSLAHVIMAAGLNIIDIEKSGYGGSLYGIATKRSDIKKYVMPSQKNGKQFFKKSETSLKRFTDKLAPLINQKKIIGFYMPLRAFPYLSNIKMPINIRIFDDIAHWHNGFIDGFDFPIENFDDLLENPVEHLFIMSLTFGEALEAKINDQIPGIKVHRLDQIISTEI